MSVSKSFDLSYAISYMAERYSCDHLPAQVRNPRGFLSSKLEAKFPCMKLKILNQHQWLTDADIHIRSNGEDEDASI